MCVLSHSVCLTLCNSMDCSWPGPSVHGILQARTLEWVAMPSSRGSSQPRDQTQMSHIAGRFFTVWATRETPWRKVTENKYMRDENARQLIINHMWKVREKKSQHWQVPQLYWQKEDSSHCWLFLLPVWVCDCDREWY